MANRQGRHDHSTAVQRRETSHVFTSTSTPTGDVITHAMLSGGLYKTTLQVNNQPVQTVSNSPLAAILISDTPQANKMSPLNDKSEIHLYYISPISGSSNGSVREIYLKTNENGWQEGSLTKYLSDMGVVTHPESGMAAFTVDKYIKVFFREANRPVNELFVAIYMPEISMWVNQRLLVKD